jgi:hypothetical protein
LWLGWGAAGFNFHLGEIDLERHATQILKGMNRLNLIETLFLISIEALLYMKIVAIGSQNMTQNRYNMIVVYLLGKESLRLTGEIIGIERGEPLILLRKSEFVLGKPSQIMEAEEAEIPEYAFNQFLWWLLSKEFLLRHCATYLIVSN